MFASYPHPFCPDVPHPKQREFLTLACLEAFFGGAAGGGKSNALLMAALQYVDVPGYAALLVRKDSQRLALPSGLIPRSHQWLAGSAAQWNAQRRQWTFPHTHGPPATLSFGYLDSPLDKYRYASSEFQFIGFDELTDLREDDYLFLFSRLRRIAKLDVPLRVRSASNPGNSGHLWVKQRFVVSSSPERVFIPSRIADNPSLREDEYRHSLSYLPPLERERLMQGDWNVQEQGVFPAAWLRYFVETRSPDDEARAMPSFPAPLSPRGRGVGGEGEAAREAYDVQLELLDAAGRLLVVVPEHSCRRFVTIDPAGTSADKAREARGRPASWTVVQVWDQPPRELARFLLLREQVRERVAFDGLVAIVQTIHASWLPQRIYIEDEKLGHAVRSVLEREGLPIDLIRTHGRDKLTRASDLILKMQRGEIFLPRLNNDWRPAFEAELLAWTGREDEPSDQIDAAAYAAIIASQHNPRPLRLQPIVQRS